MADTAIDPRMVKWDEGGPPDPKLVKWDEPAKTSQFGMDVNSINQGLAAGLDMIPNAPANLLNLLKARIGQSPIPQVISSITGKPPSEYMPELSQTPDLVQRAFEAAGFTRPEAMQGGVRGAMLRGGGAALSAPQTSIPGILANFGMGAAGGGAGELAAQAGLPAGAQIAAGQLPMFAPVAARALTNAAFNPSVMQENIKSFEGAGTEPNLAQAAYGTKGWVPAAAAQNVLAIVPGGAGPQIRQNLAQAEQIGNKAQSISENLSPGATPEIAGRKLQSGITGFVSGVKADWRSLNKPVSEALKGQPISADNTMSALRALSGKVEGSPELSGILAAPKVPQITAALEKLLEGPSVSMGGQKVENPKLLAAILDQVKGGEGGSVKYEVLRDLRSNVGARLAEPGLTPDIPTGDLKRLYGALTDDLRTAANKAGVGKQFDRENSFYKAAMSRISDNLEQVAGKVNPEDAYVAATSGDKYGASKLRAILKSVPEDAGNALRATVIKRMGLANPGNQTAEGDRFSPATFLTKWATMSSEAKNAMSAGNTTLRRDLDNLSKTVERIKETQQILINPSGTARMTMRGAAAATAIGAVASGSASTLFGLLGGTVGANAASRLMVNPKFVKWFSETASMPPEKLASRALVLSEIAKSSDPEERDAMEMLAGALNKGQ